MKTFIPFTIAATLAASGISHAQAFSKPSGYVSQVLAANQFNLVGLSLHDAPISSGDFETVAGTVLTDSDAAITVAPGRTYVLEITSGAIAGTIQALGASSITATTVTTTDDLATMGLLVGDTYNIRLAPTLEEIFGVDSNSILKRSLSPNTADIVWVPNGSGGYDQYFVHTANGGEFRIVGTTTTAPNIPIIYSDGMLVQKRGTVSTLVTTGQVKTTGTNSVVVQGFNLVSIVAPTGLTLFTSGLADDLKASLNPNTADLVWVPQAGGLYKQYFRHTASGGNWRDVEAPTVALVADFDLPPMVLVQRRSATPGNISLDVPSSYSNL